MDKAKIDGLVRKASENFRTLSPQARAIGTVMALGLQEMALKGFFDDDDETFLKTAIITDSIFGSYGINNGACLDDILDDAVALLTNDGLDIFEDL